MRSPISKQINGLRANKNLSHGSKTRPATEIYRYAIHHIEPWRWRQILSPKLWKLTAGGMKVSVDTILAGRLDLRGMWSEKAAQLLFQKDMLCGYVCNMRKRDEKLTQNFCRNPMGRDLGTGCNSKGIPVTSRGGPQDNETSRLPYFLVRQSAHRWWWGQPYAPASL
jgi:hypothetical protein